MNRRIKVALIGNPNTGKSSVFNLLTGLRQKTGNYPGITVEKKEGYCRLTSGASATIFDLPGTYSLNASSLDENIVIELLMNRNHADFPDVAVIVADIENIKRNLLLFTQIKDLGIPSILVVNMSDRMRRKGISLDVEKMEEELNTKIVLTSTLKRRDSDAKKGNCQLQSIGTFSLSRFSIHRPRLFYIVAKNFPQTIHLQAVVGNHSRCQFCQYRSKHHSIHRWRSHTIGFVSQTITTARNHQTLSIYQ